MLDHTARSQAWLADLAAINKEIALCGLPIPARVAPRRTRKRRPFWEE